MLNRHILRAKVLQSIYSYYVGRRQDTPNATEHEILLRQEKALFNNLHRIYDLEVYLFSALLEIRDIAEEEIEEGKNKFIPTMEELDPNTRFIDNPVFKQIAECEQLKSAIKKLHISWKNEKLVLKNIYLHFKESQAYATYITCADRTYEDDKAMMCNLFKNYLIRNENFTDELVARGFSWVDDYDFVCQVVYNVIRDWSSEDDCYKILPSPFYRDLSDKLESDEDFTTNLLRNTITHWEEYDHIIERRTVGWDKERIAFVDLILIKMAMSEFVYSPTIPLRVTLNEYIELAKEFSTEKSRLFVNGILDRIIVDLRMANQIHKLDSETDEEEE